jgi:hypothetical protein
MATPINGFQAISVQISTSNILERILAKPNTQFYENDAIYINDGVGTQVTATAQATHVFVNIVTAQQELRPATQYLTTAIGEVMLAAPVASGLIYFKTNLVGVAAPLKNLIACNANTNPAEIIFNDTGSSGDLLYGQAWVDNIMQQSLITGDVLASGVRTLTIYPSFWRAATTGDHVIAVPWSKGATGVQFNIAGQSSQYIDPTVAGKTGGTINIQDVFLGPLLAAGSASGIPYYQPSGTFVPYAVVSL